MGRSFLSSTTSDRAAMSATLSAAISIFYAISPSSQFLSVHAIFTLESMCL